jgi:hypothetical protein
MKKIIRWLFFRKWIYFEYAYKEKGKTAKWQDAIYAKNFNHYWNDFALPDQKIIETEFYYRPKWVKE